MLIKFKARKAQQVRNSVFVSIPQGVAEAWGLKQGSLIDIKLFDDKLILEPKEDEN